MAGRKNEMKMFGRNKWREENEWKKKMIARKEENKLTYRKELRIENEIIDEKKIQKIN